jgi:hypothetical protein
MESAKRLGDDATRRSARKVERGSFSWCFSGERFGSVALT